MLSPPFARSMRGLLAPAILAVALSAVVGLTVAGPASAATDSSLTVTATQNAADGSGISITASGSGGSTDYVYLFVNNANTACAATPSAEQNIANGPDQPYPSTSSASGSFSFTTSANFAGRPGIRIVCAYLGGFYSDSATAQSSSETAYACPTGTSFTISDIKTATGQDTDKQGTVEDRWALTDFTVQTGFPPYSNQGGPAAPQG
jgi:hypothetical protein